MNRDETETQLERTVGVVHAWVAQILLICDVS